MDCIGQAQATYYGATTLHDQVQELSNKVHDLRRDITMTQKRTRWSHRLTRWMPTTRRRWDQKGFRKAWQTYTRSYRLMVWEETYSLGYLCLKYNWSDSRSLWNDSEQRHRRKPSQKDYTTLGRWRTHHHRILHPRRSIHLIDVQVIIRGGDTATSLVTRPDLTLTQSLRYHWEAPELSIRYAYTDRVESQWWIVSFPGLFSDNSSLFWSAQTIHRRKKCSDVPCEILNCMSDKPSDQHLALSRQMICSSPAGRRSFLLKARRFRSINLAISTRVRDSFDEIVLISVITIDTSR